MSSGGMPDVAGLREGQRAEIICLLSAKQILKTKAGKPFGSLTLQDPSGKISAKLWDQAEELLGPLKPGQVVKAGGRVQVYNGNQQIVLDFIEPAPDADPALFLPKSPYDPVELWAQMNKLVKSVKDKDLSRVLKAFFGDKEFHRDFELAPAAKGAHHAYVHGLLEHTASVGGLAQKAAEHYSHISHDLLVTGALLHDVGKVREFSLGPPIEYTDPGRLEGHLVLGVRMLDRRLARMKKFPDTLAEHLRHMILSHHGIYEFGSPKRPKTPEAMVLHLIDDLDAKTAMIHEVVKQHTDEDTHWSNYNRLLERYLYTGPSPLPEELEEQDGPPAGDAQTMSLFQTGPGQGEG